MTNSELVLKRKDEKESKYIGGEKEIEILSL